MARVGKIESCADQGLIVPNSGTNVAKTRTNVAKSGTDYGKELETDVSRAVRLRVEIDRLVRSLTLKELESVFATLKEQANVRNTAIE